MSSVEPSKLEVQVLSLLWEHGPLTARSVLELMPDGKQRAYTTILTVLQVMEKKGFVSHEAEGNRHIYAAKVKRQAVMRPMLGGWLKTLFGGRAASAMQQLLEASEVNDEELAEMRRLLDVYEKNRKGKRP